MSYEQDCDDYAVFGNPERDAMDYEENAQCDRWDGWGDSDPCDNPDGIVDKDPCEGCVIFDGEMPCAGCPRYPVVTAPNDDIPF